MTKIIGRHSVTEAIKSEKRIEKVFIRFGTEGSSITAIKNLAVEKKIKIEILDKNRFDKLAGDLNSQGVIALVSQLKFFELNEIVELSFKNNPAPVLIILENIQDSQNLGAIIRSAECFGINGLLITKDNTAPIDEHTTKASAGAIEFMPICRITNVSQTIDYLKEKKFWIIGTSDHADKKLTDLTVDFPAVLIFGNESKGLRKLTSEKCDYLVKIPMSGRISSLNVSVAAAITIYEITK